MGTGHWVRATAVIYGQDGFDLDVVANLRAFYSRLGYSVVASRTLIPSDVLVVHRPRDVAFPGFRDFGALHVYDYVGGSVSAMIDSVADVQSVAVVVPSGRRAAEWRERGRNVIVAPLPVIADLWEVPPVSTDTVSAVHVGNFKASYLDGSDARALGFVNSVTSGRVEVWGRGWGGRIPEANWHGPAKLSRVSRLYASTPVALGMMYPFQRGETYSGRFWQAPLSGARLLSEVGAPGFDFPGVRTYESASELEELLNRVPSLAERSELRRRASQYWREKTDKLADVLGSAPPQSTTDRRRTFRASAVDVARRIRHGI